MEKFFKDNKKLLYVILGLIILVELIAAYFYLVLPTQKEKQLPLPAPAKVATTSLFLAPASGNYQLGESFDVSVNLDTDKVKTVGVDLVITYDKNKLEVVDSDIKKVGTQIQEGSLYDTYPANLVDEKNGKINFGSNASPGKPPFSGSGSFAVIKFKSKGVGTAKVTIDFTPGVTTDSNVTTSDSKDILAKVENATFTIVPKT